MSVAGSREPLVFEEKDAGLRDDVRELGAIVGHVIAELPEWRNRLFAGFERS